MKAEYNTRSTVPSVAEYRPSEVIYQIYPASFADSNGDGIGDLQGIISKLDYIAFLGVDAIWLSPVYPSPPGPEGDGGYAVTDRRGIDPRFGTLDDMKQLIAEAHRRGLRVYMDDVLPHTSHEHQWFEKSRNREPGFEDFYIWHDGAVGKDGTRRPPNNWLSVFGGEGWEWDDKREQYYFHHFLKSQPALNLNRKEVQDAVLADMKFWLDLGIDGFRYDSLSYANYDPEFRDNDWLEVNGKGWDQQYFNHSHCQPQTAELVERIRQLTDSYQERKSTLGEVICGRAGGRNPMPVAAEYVDPQKGLSMCYTDVFRAITHKTDHGYLQGVVKNIIKHFPDGGHCNAIGNHDSPRIASNEMGSVPEYYKGRAIKQLLRLLATLPGSLSIYQGSELGLPDARIPEDIPLDKIKDPVAQTKGLEYCRDGARTPMPWHSGSKNAGFSVSDDPYLPVPDDHYHRAVSKQVQDPGSMLNFMRALMIWRKSQPALIRGHAAVLDTQWPLIAFTRKSGDQTMLCVFNMSEKEMMFRPSDLLDGETLKALSMSKEEVMKLEPYGSDFRGVQVYMPAFAPQQMMRLSV